MMMYFDDLHVVELKDLLVLIVVAMNFVVAEL
jgi:hypothetical protein